MREKWNLRPEPFWLLEAFACMNYVDALDSEEWLNKSSSWSRRQKEEFLLPYRSYRGEMRNRLLPVLEQYPLLKGYVDNVPREKESLRSFDPPMISFLTQMEFVLEAQERPSGEALERELNGAFGRMLDRDMQKSPEAEDVVIRGLADVMQALEGWEGEDADKFRMLRLYSERYEVMEQLWDFREVCREIGLACLPLVRERYDACMEKVQNPEELDSLLEGVGLGCREFDSCRITLNIIRYDRIMAQMLEGTGGWPDSVNCKLHIGIETFYMFSSNAEGFHDGRLLDGLKALGDSTRMKIVRKLVERPYYLQEMARELELTPATVLHHLGVLISANLIEIQMTREKKKIIYYQIKKGGFEEISRGVMQLLLTRKERETVQKEKQIQEGQQTQGGGQWTIRK